MKKIYFALLFSSSLILTSQEKGTLTLSGSLDTYFSSNLNNNSLGIIGVLSDIPAYGFGLGMANTVITYKKNKSGVVADLAYGPRANAVNAYKGAINQLYAYHQATDKITISLEQLNTFFGYEVISPVGNFNYSVSYLFNAGPFSHIGIKLDYAASEDLFFMLAITNPHAITDGANSTDDYQLGFQTGYKNQYFNLVYGADGFGFKDVLYLDYTRVIDLTNKFYLGINLAYSNYNSANAGYHGLAIYLQNKFSKTFSLGFNPEFFTTISSARNSHQSAYTLTGRKALTDNLNLITEFSYDTSKDGIVQF